MATLTPIGKWQIWLVIFKPFVFYYLARPMQNITGKSFSEAIIFASTNPQYDNRLFIELLVQYMKIASSNLGRTCCVQKLFLTFRTIFVHNMFSPCSELGIFMYWTCNSMNHLLSYCGLVDAKIIASDKDLPVQWEHYNCWLWRLQR